MRMKYLSTVPEAHREAVREHSVLSREAVAEILGISVEGVAQAESRALRKMRGNVALIDVCRGLGILPPNVAGAPAYRPGPK